MMREPKAFECTLGFDAKINRANHPFVIEINGADSGINGLAQLSGKDLSKLRHDRKYTVFGKETKVEIGEYSPEEAAARGYEQLVFFTLAVLRLSHQIFMDVNWTTNYCKKR